MHAHNLTRFSVIAVVLGVWAVLGGCQEQMAAMSGVKTVSPADFAVHDGDVAQESTAAATVDEPAATATATATEAATTTNDVVAMDTTAVPAPAETIDQPKTTVASASPSSPTASADIPGPTTKRVIVDSLIGQVNGRPIFADTFFEPIEDQMLAARAQLKPQDFMNTMGSIIHDRLRQVIFNELVLAEAEADLTPEMRTGLRYWLKDVEEKKVAESLGVRSQAEERVAAEGLTMDEFLRLRKDEALVANLVRLKIRPKVIVTWRDLEREYDRRASEFSPPASVKLGKIVLNKEREGDMVDAVTKGLAEGQSLTDISKSLARSSAYSEDEYTLGPNGLADLPLKPNMLKVIEGLKVGETSEPVEVTIQAAIPGEPPRVSVYWYSILAITQNEAHTLYDPVVQRQLYNELYNRRLQEEQDRYLDSLMSKGIYDNIGEMEMRLRRVALLRYGQR